MNIKLNKNYLLYIEKNKPPVVVVPFDGEKFGMLGLSHGFIHYLKAKDKTIGFCGVSYFEKHSEFFEKE
jgi:hypothetical protein